MTTTKSSSISKKTIASVVLAALTLSVAAQPAFALSPAQTIRNLKLALPIGTIELADAQLQINEGADNKPESFRGTARVKLPAVGPLVNLKLPDLVRADVGLDKGAALSNFGAPLDPERRYFYLSFGSGLNLSRQFDDAAGDTQTLSITVPAGERVALIIDPEQPLVFVNGKFNVNYTGDLAVISQLLVQRGITVPGLENVKLPGTGTIVISGTLAPGTDKSFIELSAGTGIGAGPIGAIIGVQAQPLAVQGNARIDKDGATISGEVTSKVAPDKVLDGSGKVQVRVPFDGQQPFVDLTGALSVPPAQAQAEGSQRFTVDGQAIADAVRFSAEAAKSGAKSAGNAITVTIASAAATGADIAKSAGNIITVTVGAATQAGGNVLAGVQDTLSGTLAAASPVISDATGAISDTVGTAPAAISNAWQGIMDQVCKAAGGC